MILTFQMHFPAVEATKHYVSVTVPNDAKVRDVVTLKFVNSSYLRQLMQKQVFQPNHPFL